MRYMLAARRDSDPGAGAGDDHLLASGVPILTGPNTRGPCARKSMNPTLVVKIGLRRHTQSSVPCSPALVDALSSWNQSESPKESKVRSVDHFYRSSANSRAAAL